MALTKHAGFAVLAARIAAEGSPLMRTAHRHEFEYTPRPGYLYVRSRMISSRCNDNFDEFPAPEIKTAYRTFIGKPVFVNHHNDNHRRARGVIKDAVLHEDVNPDGSPDTWVEGLMEVDAIRFPKLAAAILAGEIDRTSMGTDVQYSVCSFCGNKASTPIEYCKHIPKMKGQRIYRTTASGAKEGILVREICYGLGFFENSLLVEEPADPTAYFLGVDARGLGKAASKQATSLYAAIQAEAGPKPPLNLGHTISWRVAPDGSWSAECECGRPFPNRATAGEAYIDALTHGTIKHPDYDENDVSERERALHAPKPPAPSKGPRREDTWQTSTNPDAWTLASRQSSSWTSEEDDDDPDPADTLQRHRRHIPYTPARDWDDDNDAHPLDLLARHPKSDSNQWQDDLLNHSHASKTASAVNYEVGLDCGDSVRYVGTQGGQVTKGQNWNCKTHGEVKVSEVGGPGTTTNGLGMDRHASKTALAPGANNEHVVAPAEVDTLRDEQCPVCGEQDAFDGDKCQVCQFVAPPDEFGDPDLDAAKKTDLRQDKDDSNDSGGDLTCDHCSATFSSTPATPKQAVVLDPANAPETPDESQAEVQSKAGDTCPSCGEGTLQPNDAVDPQAVADGTEQADDGFAPAGSASEDDADDQDSSDGTDDEDGEDGDKPDFLTKKKDSKKPTAARRGSLDGEGADVAMRPALAALAAQQKQIQALQAGLAFVAEVAGLDKHPRITSALKVAVDENPAFGGGWDNGAPVEGAPEAPSQSTQEAATPQAKDDVESVGSAPLTDVSPAATTSLDSDGVVLDVPLTLNDQDVTAPVAGTDTLGQGERGGAGTNRTETEIRSGTPSDNSAAFRDGGFLGSKGEARTIASLRLARLQIQAGIAVGDDLDLSQVIASSDKSDEAIAAEISTLGQVVTASTQRQPVSRSLVPRSASQAQRTLPSMTASADAAPQQEIVGSVHPDEIGFE